MELIKDIIADSIQIEKKEIQPCLQQVNFTVPADKVEKGYNTIARAFAKEAKISGFRSGKAPISVVKSLYKDKIQEETVKELVSFAFNKGTEDLKDDMISYKFSEKENPEVKLGSDFTFSVQLNVAPKIELPNYTGVKIEIPKLEIKEEEIEKRLDYFRDIYGKFEKSDSAAEANDMLKVSYTSDIELPEDAPETAKRLVNAEENYLWLNENDIIPGMNKYLHSAEAGKDYEAEIVFPDNYNETSLSGKKGNYKVNVIEVQRKSPIKSDEELCSKLMVKDLDELKNRLKEQSEMELDNNTRSLKENKLIEIISKDLDFPIPPDMLEEAIQAELKKIMESKFGQDKDQNKAKEEFEKNKEEFLKEAKVNAEKHLRVYLLLRKIAHAENINVEPDEFDSHVDNMSRYYGYNNKDLKQRLLSSGNYTKIVDNIMIQKVTDFLINKAEIEFTDSKSNSETK